MRNDRDFHFKTPEIPESIRNIRLSGYLNIWEIASTRASVFPSVSHRNLWGTETLCGDWDGNVLIVLKDFGSVDRLEGRSDGRPFYSHAPEFPTNRNLVRILQHHGVAVDLHGQDNLDCGIVYASACFLLELGHKSNTHVTSEALRVSWPAIEFTIANMCNLTDIMLCGVEAFKTFKENGGLAANREEMLRRGIPATWRNYRVHASCHTQPTAINCRLDPKGLGRKGLEVTLDEWSSLLTHASDKS